LARKATTRKTEMARKLEIGGLRDPHQEAGARRAFMDLLQNLLVGVSTRTRTNNQ